MDRSSNPIRAALGVSVGWVGISMIGDGVPALLLPHRLLTGGVTDATTLGVVTLVGIALAAAVQPFAGRWSDRVGRVPVIGIGAIVATAGLLALVATPAVATGAIVALVGASIAQAGYQPMLPDRLPRRWRGRAGGLKSAFDVGGAMLGFVLLGALVGAGEPVLAGVALAAVLVIGFAVSGFLTGRGSPAPSADKPAGETRVALLRVVAARFLFLLGIYAVGRFLLLFVADRFELSPDTAAADAGMALALLALVTVAASLPAGWLADRIGRRALMVGGGLVGGAGIGLLPAADSMVALMAAGSLMAIGSATFGSASWAMLADLSPAPRAGGALGIANLGTAGAAAAAGGFGAVIDLAGFAPAFALAAACSVAGAIVALTLAERTTQPMLAASAEGAS
ncbi:MAG TPA: MFS transporter [Candidatus Limnocylindria bacterium]|nr:MFS transporter [Candidatus Limnocylindria bacterium]